VTTAIHSLAARARDQIRAGIAELHAGNPLACEVFLRAAIATVQSLVALLGEPAPMSPPMRKLAIVRAPSGEECPIEPWMEKKHDGGGDAA